MSFTSLARQLRGDQTDVEKKLWSRLRNRQFLNYKFRRQFVIEPYIVDFVCLDLKLIVELDGSQHNDDIDAERSLFLESCGFKILRFWNNDLIDNLDGVLERIQSVVEDM